MSTENIWSINISIKKTRREVSTFDKGLTWNYNKRFWSCTSPSLLDGFAISHSWFFLNGVLFLLIKHELNFMFGPLRDSLNWCKFWSNHADVNNNLICFDQYSPCSLTTNSFSYTIFLGLHNAIFFLSKFANTLILQPSQIWNYNF